MSAVNALTSTVIVLEFVNIFLFILLFVTPAPKHSMVKALILSCLFRSVLDILPPIVRKVNSELLGGTLGVVRIPSAVSFCVVDSILLGYITVVKAAFAVSFTLPLLWMVLVQLQPKRSADDWPRLTRCTVLTLCAAPFAWALPVLITPLPRIIRRQVAEVTYDITSCYFDDPAFTIVSLVFTLLPLAIAVVITVIMVSIIWRFSNTMLEHTGWNFVKTKRFVRFGALVLVSMISASLYTVVLSQWIRGHREWAGDHEQWKNDKKWLRIFRTSVIWEAITPMLFFVIFAAQEEIYETWLGWLSYVTTFPFKKHDGRPGNCPQMSQHVPSEMTVTYRESPTHGAPICIFEQTVPATTPQQPRPVPPSKIISRPLSSLIITDATHGEGRKGRSQSNPALGGLRPPPRPKQGVSYAMDERWHRKSSRFHLALLNDPSSTTFGSHYSSHGVSGSTGDVCTVDDGVSSMSTEKQEGPSKKAESTMHSCTAGSTTTFGHCGAPRK